MIRIFFLTFFILIASGLVCQTFEFEYSTENDDRLWDTFEDEFGNFFLVGHEAKPLSNHYSGLILKINAYDKTDSLGNYEWEIILEGPYQDGNAILCNSEDGNIIVASRYDTDSIHEFLFKSRVKLTKIDNSGNIFWSYLLGKQNHCTKLGNIRSDNKGDIINGSLSEYHPTTANDLGFMINTDKNGDSLCYRQYSILNGFNSFNFLYDAIPTTDGGFLAGGYCLPVDPDTGSQDAWAIKIDSLGCESPWDCWVNIEEIVDELPATSEDFTIYPNPVNGVFTIKLGNKTKEQHTVSVYNLYGIKVEEIDIPKGNQSLKLDSSSWQSGFYVALIMSNNKVIGKRKFVVR